jgi:NTP pyrophosphatase (non-canonical NTP hydrolase)
MRAKRSGLSNKPNDIKKLTDIIVDFNVKRDWKQFHNPKDLALSLTLEAAEVLELFQWKSPEEIDKFIKTNKKEVSKELADTFYWVLLMAYYLKIDIAKELKEKMKENIKKYPVKKSKGKHLKYTEYTK